MNQRKSYKREMWLEVAGESVRVLISASARKTMRLQITEEGEVDVRVPLHCNQGDVLAFVNANHRWLKERRDIACERLQRREGKVMILGKERVITRSALDSFLVTDQLVWVPETWNSAKIDKAVDHWLRSEGRMIFEQMIDQWWPFFSHFNVRRPTLRIKKMRTRWGSLSTRGYINLNLALMQLPLDLIELVVVHELCHLKHFDHGPGFRRLMAECLPDWQQRDKQLNHLSQNVL
jgi:predicted metal-dependent hydrolase